ncbi:AAA family ATPase [Planctomonas psychrotolerans]|uniref:AAA family ATPase n=1 Tax=Planctomonas psychrotolerans TaxID=2528712 RepID=UPI00123BAD22|nr:AAA family ATPase [Planctomonas psychrotolerans]
MLSDIGPEQVEDPLSNASHNTTAPHALNIGDPHFEAGNVAQPTWQRWRGQLAAVGGTSPLLHFVDTPRTRIELSTTHPGGLAQFITGKSTLLSSLLRDEVALRSARVAAGDLTQKGIELLAARGIDSVHLAIGLAEWRNNDGHFLAPVLLRPLAIRRHGRDFELKLTGSPYLNPSLARALHEQFSITLDAKAFVALAMSDGSFKPQPVIDRLRGLTSHLPAFDVQPRLVVSSFAEVGPAMARDAADLDHLVLDALAGNPTARWGVTESYAPVEPIHQDDRPPVTDTLLLDADSEQEFVIAQINAGNSVVVQTLPGTGGTQTIVNSIGCLVAQHKRVLVVSPRHSTLRGIAHRLGDIGLPGLAVSPGSLRRDIVGSISRNEKARKPQVSEVDDALVRLRHVLLDYRRALNRKDSVLGVSVLDALGELARLALLPHPPATTARLTRESIEALAHDRTSAADALIKAAALGEFRYGPDDSPWYGANFPSTDAATSAHELAKQLHSTELPELIDKARALIGTTKMRQFESIAELGVYVRLLLDVRDTLDKFQPVVFDRSLSELITATAPRRDRSEMSGANRRRLRKLAREYVRPGVHIGDMHASLVSIQQQRILWQRYVAGGVTPEVPVGLAEVEAAYERVAEDLAVLDEPLSALTRPTPLAELLIPELRGKVEGLAEDSEVLANLQERTALLADLRALNLDPLLHDLSHRHVPQQRVGAELELVWWQSVLEHMLASDKALLNANTSVLDRLESDFRLVDEAHAGGSAQLLAWQLAETWKIGLVDWADEARELKELLRTDDVDAAGVQRVAPHLSRTVAPVWLASPYEVPDITDGMPFDALFLVDAGALTLAESVGAIRRAKQTVVFGDPVTQTPSPFTIGLTEPDRDGEHRPRDGEPSLDELHADSALARLGELLPVLSLTRSYRAGGEDLAELVNRRFYGGRIQSLPWAGTFLGHGSLSLDFVENGHGMADEDTGAVESVDAEVARVVELVLDHARWRPRESLMVITASAKHAVRVQQAVLAAAAKRSDVTEFFLGDSAEPFMVATLEQSVAQSRDRVIFSIGYGRTPHGRVLSNFGALAAPGGERLLAVGMTRARRSMVIVSCFQPSDIEEDRMRHGIVALAQILAEAKARTTEETVPDDSDAMLVDLARRLEVLGLEVSLGHRGKLGLVASFQGRAIAIETDSIVGQASLRESLRLRPEMLKRLGWHYLRVHSFELFADPDAVASKIAKALGAASRHSAPHTEPIPIQTSNAPDAADASDTAE